MTSRPTPGAKHQDENRRDFAEAMLDELLAPTKEGVVVSARKSRNEYPEGYQPGAEFNGEEGWMTTRAVDGPVTNWDEHLRQWGLDPDKVEVIEPVTFKTWEGYGRGADGELETIQMRAYKARIRTRSGWRADYRDIEEMIREIKKKRALAASKSGTGDHQQVGNASVFTVNLSDWQLAKVDGDGLEGTVNRIYDMIGMVQDRYRDLKKTGVDIARIDVNSLGDMVEGCSGHYAMQTFGVQLNYRDQRKLLRRLLVEALDSWANLGVPIHVRAVGGNHGEERSNGKAFTDFGDNMDVEAFEQVHDIMSANPDRYEHVRFFLPNRDLTLTYRSSGLIIGLAHGHQFSRGGNPQQKALNWWKGQMEGQQPIGDADVLVSGHYHHLLVVQQGPRTWFQCPTLDGGSEWWRNQTGLDSPPGTLTFVTTPFGWDHLAVLGGWSLEAPEWAESGRGGHRRKPSVGLESSAGTGLEVTGHSHTKVEEQAIAESIVKKRSARQAAKKQAESRKRSARASAPKPATKKPAAKKAGTTSKK